MLVLNLEDFEIGVFATVNRGGADFAPSLDSASVIYAPFVSVVNDYIDVKLTGIPKVEADTSLVFCICARVNGIYYYLDGGVASETVSGISYGAVAN